VRARTALAPCPVGSSGVIAVPAQARASAPRLTAMIRLAAVMVRVQAAVEIPASSRVHGEVAGDDGGSDLAGFANTAFHH
jgi:hypothetical protein